ncbi:MAG: hypothetical protein WC384_18315 [Prolixibacteraceae bacterium]|jgi:predicted nucleic acid-binding protein
MDLLYSTNDILNNLRYKDETWNQIKYIGDYMWNDLFKWKCLKQTNKEHFIDNNCENTKVIVDNEHIQCKSCGKKNDWIYLNFTKTINVPYLIEFDAKILSKTTEFQFAFNYHSIGKRYRYNLVNNRILSFEVVYGGFFHSEIISVPFSLNLNRFYNFKILVTDNIFSFFVDDIVILSVNQKFPIIERGQLVFILWDSNTSNINAIYKNIQIYKIQPSE